MKHKVSPSGSAWADRLPALAVAGAAFLAYANTLSNGFVFDDNEQILGNIWLTDFRFFKEIFSSNVWGFMPGLVSNYYRPLMHAAYLALYQAFGPKPFAFHLLNVLLQAANSVLVFVIVERLLKSERADSRSDSTGARRARIAALAAGILFAVHTIHTETVAWVAGLPDVAFTFFILLVFAWHLRPGPWPRWAFGCSAVAFLTALLFKETAIVLLPLLVAHDVLWPRSTPMRERLTRYFPLAGALFLYLSLRISVLGWFGVQRPLKPYGVLEAPAYAANILYFFALYIGKLIVPIHLNALSDFIPLKSLLDGHALLGIGVFAACLAAVIATWRRRPRVCFALLFVVVPLLPVFLVPAYSLSPFGERYLYLPSVGLCLVVALATERLFRGSRASVIAWGSALVAVSGAMLAGTVARNQVWQSDLTLFADVVSKSPRSEIANGNLGRALLAANRSAEAIPLFRTALVTNPDSVKARYHLGFALLKNGQAAEAIPELERVQQINPGRDETGSLAEAYGAVGRFADAIAKREVIVAAAPGIPAEHNLLGIDYARAERYEDAIREFEISVRLDPNEPAYRRNLDRAKEKIRR